MSEGASPACRSRRRTRCSSAGALASSCSHTWRGHAGLPVIAPWCPAQPPRSGTSLWPGKAPPLLRVMHSRFATSLCHLALCSSAQYTAGHRRKQFLPSSFRARQGKPNMRRQGMHRRPYHSRTCSASKPSTSSSSAGSAGAELSVPSGTAAAAAEYEYSAYAPTRSLASASYDSSGHSHEAPSPTTACRECTHTIKQPRSASCPQIGRAQALSCAPGSTH